MYEIRLCVIVESDLRFTDLDNQKLIPNPAVSYIKINMWFISFMTSVRIKHVISLVLGLMMLLRTF